MYNKALAQQKKSALSNLRVCSSFYTYAVKRKKQAKGNAARLAKIAIKTPTPYFANLNAKNHAAKANVALAHATSLAAAALADTQHAEERLAALTG